MKLKNYISLLALIVIALSTFWFYFIHQSPQDYDKCFKCDGQSYRSIYDNFKGDNYENIDSPFNTRIIVPFLASLGPFQSVVDNFHMVNIIFITFSIIAIYFLWLKLQIPISLQLMGFFWLFFHWTGLVRHKLFDPINVDTPLYLFHTLLLLIIYKRKYIWLLPLTVIATAQKESFPAYLIIFLVYGYLHNAFYEKYFNLKIILYSIVLAFITKWVLIYYFPPANEALNSFYLVLYYLKEVIFNPINILVWIVAVFTSYGAFLFTSISKKSNMNTGAENNVLFLFAATSIFLSISGGGDYTRIAFLGFPFVMTYLLMRLRTVPIIVSIIGFLLSLPLLRLSQMIPLPDYQEASHSWFVEFSSLENIVFWGIYMIICFVVVRLTSKILS